MSEFDQVFLQLNSIFWRYADITEGTKASGYTIDDSFSRTMSSTILRDAITAFGLFIKLTLGTVPSYSDDFFEC